MNILPENEVQGVLHDFLSRFASDRDAGKVLELSHYQAAYPGFESLIAEEYGELSKGDDEDLAAEHPPPLYDRLGPYRLIRELGHGGQGVVYLAEQEGLHRPVALKVLSSRLDLGSKALARFRREAEMASRLNHPGICAVYDAGELDGIAFIAMQHVEGESLAAKLTRARQEGLTQVTPLPVGATPSSGKGDSTSSSRHPIHVVAALVEEAARAVHAVHLTGVVHRDLKPGNIMVTPEGRPVILDFGLASEDEVEGEQLTRSGDILGTPVYMAPERVRGEKHETDARADVYGLGATLYECLTLKRPFEAPTREGLYRKILSEEATAPSRSNPQVPRDLDVVVQTALEKNADRRYQTALDLAEDLRRVRSHVPIRAKPAGPLLRLRRWAQRNPVVATLLVLLSAALATTVFSLNQTRSTQGVAEQRLEHARALGLVGASQAVMGSDEVLALLLAREAFRREEIPETRTQLHAALSQLHERALISEEADIIRGPQVSESGRYFFHAVRGSGKVDLMDREGNLLHTFPAPANLAGFLPDEDRFFTQVGDAHTILWRLDEELGVRELGRIPNDEIRGPPGAVQALEAMTIAVSPSGDALCFCYARKGARLWYPEGEELTRGPLLEAGENADGLAVFSPDGTLVLTVPGWQHFYRDDCSATPRLWDVASGECIASLEGHELQVLSAVFSHGGDRILTASKDRTARVWTIEEDRVEPGPVLRGHGSWVVSAVFSPDDERILTASYDKTAALWEDRGTHFERLRILDRHEGSLWGAQFSRDPEGRWILTWGTDKTLRLWDREGEEQAVLRGHQMWVLYGYFLQGSTPRDCRVLSTAGDFSTRIWSLDDEALPVYRGHRGQVTGAFYLPDETGKWSRVVTASDDGRLRFWDDSGRALGELEFPTRLVHLQVSDRGDRILSGEGSQVTLRSWNGERATEVHRLEPRGPGRGPVFSMALAPRGDKALYGYVWGADPVVCWDERAPEEFVHLEGLWYPRALAFSPDGEICFAAGNEDQLGMSVTLRRSRDGSVLETLTDEIGEAQGVPTACAFSPGGQEFALGSTFGSLMIFRREGGVSEKMRVHDGHDGEVTSICYSRDGSRILTASMDGKAILWTREGERIMDFVGHEGPVLSASFHPDGSRILTASSDGTARTWFAQLEDLGAHVEKRLEGRVITPEVRQRYADLLPAGE